MCACACVCGGGGGGVDLNSIMAATGGADVKSKMAVFTIIMDNYKTHPYDCLNDGHHRERHWFNYRYAI